MPNQDAGNATEHLRPGGYRILISRRQAVVIPGFAIIIFLIPQPQVCMRVVAAKVVLSPASHGRYFYELLVNIKYILDNTTNENHFCLVLRLRSTDMDGLSICGLISRNLQKFIRRSNCTIPKPYEPDSLPWPMGQGHGRVTECHRAPRLHQLRVQQLGLASRKLGV